MRQCITLIVFLLLYTPNVVAPQEYYIYVDNVYAQWFTEPVESAYFLWADGTRIQLTSYEWNKVSGNPDEVLEDIKKQGVKIEYCLIIIHNHILPSGFSDTDRGFYRRMKEAGFMGMFLLYVNGKTYIIED